MPQSAEKPGPRRVVAHSQNRKVQAGARPPAPELQQALQDCHAASIRGYSLAKENLVTSAKAIKAVTKSLQECMDSLEDGSVRTPGVTSQLRTQLSNIIKGLAQLQKQSAQDLEERHKRLGRFSVTLFGRTLAGKSTLMEILTHGQGRSIGKGAQRTTRDVRSYPWNGLEVTDVPGIAAFEGAEDETLAFKAAAQADLVLFLITDDAPQHAEAVCLAKVRRLGKPVLGILNVKMSLNDASDLKLFLRNPAGLFEPSRLDQIISQFHELADQHLPGRRLPFLPTHLRARFLAGQAEFFPHQKQLIEASRFSQVEARIVREIVGRGTFLRIKSFIDGAVTPMADVSDLLLEFSAQNAGSGRVLIDKRRQLRNWLQEFTDRGSERIRTKVTKFMDGLREEVPGFAEDYYEDASAGDQWKSLVESHGLEGKAKNLQAQFLEETKKVLSEIARELEVELSLVGELAADRQFGTGEIFDLKRAWNWGYKIVSGGLGIAALILASGPLGWAAAAVSAVGWVISWFMDDREEKARQARSRLEKSLLKAVDKMEQELRAGLLDWFYQDLLFNRVEVLLTDLEGVTNSLFMLANAQRTLAWTLIGRQKELTRTLVNETLRQNRATLDEANIRDVARVPGMATMLLIPPGTTIPPAVRVGLERTLGEPVWFAIDTGNWLSILGQAIGKQCDRGSIRLEDQIRVAHIPLDDLGPVALARVRLAQQLTGFHIMR